MLRVWHHCNMWVCHYSDVTWASWCLKSLQWHHNGHDGVSNHQPHHCLLNCLFRCRSKKASKLRVTGLCEGNSLGPVNSPHKWPVMRKMFPFDDVIVSLATQLSIHQFVQVNIIQHQKQADIKASHYWPFVRRPVDSSSKRASNAEGISMWWHHHAKWVFNQWQFKGTMEPVYWDQESLTKSM